MIVKIGGRSHIAKLRPSNDGHGWTLTLGPFSLTPGAARLLGLEVEDATPRERGELERLGFDADVATVGADTSAESTRHLMSGEIPGAVLQAPQRGPLHTALIAVGADLSIPRIEGSFLWRANISRTLAAPGELVAVARMLGPDMIVMTADGAPNNIHAVVEALRCHPATRRSAVILLSNDRQAWGLDAGGLTLTLPTHFDETDESAPAQQWLAQILNLSRRREKRTPLDCGVDACLVGERTRAHIIARAVNLSHAGLLLSLPEGVPVGRQVDLSFVARSGLPRIVVRGEVVQTAQSTNRGWLAGIRFTIVRRTARRALGATLRALRLAEEQAPPLSPAMIRRDSDRPAAS